MPALKGISPPSSRYEIPFTPKKRRDKVNPTKEETLPTSKLRIRKCSQIRLWYCPRKTSSRRSLYCQNRKKKKRAEPNTIPTIGTRLKIIWAADEVHSRVCVVCGIDNFLFLEYNKKIRLQNLCTGQV